VLLADDKIWDQNGFNDIVHRQLGPSVDEDSGLVYAYDGNLKLGILPSSIFCSGHTYFVQVGSNFIFKFLLYELCMLYTFCFLLHIGPCDVYKQTVSVFS